MTGHLYLIVAIGGRSVALPASQVESVVEVDAIARVPRVAPHVAGLFALRSRVLTVIDTLSALGLGCAVRDGVHPAAIVLVDGHAYALLVDRIDDVIEGPPPGRIPAVLDPRWTAAATGVVTHEGAALLLLDPAALVGGCRPAAAAA